jgi:formamidopyrimidine-DNA glycosylase
MPELPEVETVKLGLQPVLEHHRIIHAETRRGDLRVPFPNDFAGRVTGKTVTALRRRAKYILADLDSGETLVIHLGMSGRMTVYASGAKKKLGNYVHDMHEDGIGKDKHDHVIFDTDAPARIVFNDHRRFGLMLLIDTPTLEEHKLFKSLGIEALAPEFDAAYLTEAFEGKKTPVKAALLDQRVIAGLGNIYVCEALFRAGISPKRLAGKVAPEKIKALVTAIKQVLREAIRAGGSSLRDHRQATGELGYFQKRFAVYDREGEPCPHGHGTVRRIVQSGRSTFYCPRCQK